MAYYNRGLNSFNFNSLTYFNYTLGRGVFDCSPFAENLLVVLNVSGLLVQRSQHGTGSEESKGMHHASVCACVPFKNRSQIAGYPIMVSKVWQPCQSFTFNLHHSSQNAIIPNVNRLSTSRKQRLQTILHEVGRDLMVP